MPLASPLAPPLPPDAAPSTAASGFAQSVAPSILSAEASPPAVLPLLQDAANTPKTTAHHRLAMTGDHSQSQQELKAARIDASATEVAAPVMHSRDWWSSPSGRSPAPAVGRVRRAATREPASERLSSQRSERNVVVAWRGDVVIGRQAAVGSVGFVRGVDYFDVYGDVVAVHFAVPVASAEAAGH